MKNYKQILEAVNRGIKLALDDFDDEEQVQNVKSKQINHRDYTKEHLDFYDSFKKMYQQYQSANDAEDVTFE